MDIHEKIYGIKTVPSLEAISIQAENIGGIPASEMFFSNSNEPIVINGDLIIESEVSITSDIHLAPTGSVNGLHLMNDLFLVDIPFKGLKNKCLKNFIDFSFVQGHVKFDSLDVDGARIVEVFFANESIILPPHLSLNDINPENFEQIQIDDFVVEDNLNVVEINGGKLDEIFGSKEYDNVR